jgi:hypothetical protein
MLLNQDIGEFAIQITGFSIETDRESVYIRWHGQSNNLKNIFQEIDKVIDVDGHIFVSNNVNDRYGNFNLLPHTHNSRFYENSRLKVDTVAISCHEKKSIAIDNVVSVDRFAFLLNAFKTISTRAENKIWVKAKIQLEEFEQINNEYIAPTRDAFLSNIGSGANCFYAFNTMLNFSFYSSFNPINF